MIMRCKETHPTVEKINKIIALAEELGITLSFEQNHIIVKDTKSVLPPDAATEFEMIDAENTEEAIEAFPPDFEYSLIFTHPNILT